ncbi:hypothetical protein [Streptomyces sp. NPDC088725]|uniref:hypothetical protein n=1 Tax=Streptomyces sp. NPDC088725 TaxID=3365873 RepID=UPI00382A0870
MPLETEPNSLLRYRRSAGVLGEDDEWIVWHNGIVDSPAESLARLHALTGPARITGSSDIRSTIPPRRAHQLAFTSEPFGPIPRRRRSFVQVTSEAFTSATR